MHRIAWLIAALSILAFLYSGYAFVFFAWATATPLDAPQLARAQTLANTWLCPAGLSLAVGVAAILFAIRRRT